MRSMGRRVSMCPDSTAMWIVLIKLDRARWRSYETIAQLLKRTSFYKRVGILPTKYDIGQLGIAVTRHRAHVQQTLQQHCVRFYTYLQLNG